MTHAATLAEPAGLIREHRRRLLAHGKVPGLRRAEFDAFPSGMTEGPGELLRSLVVHSRARRTIETGFALGLSGLFILEGLLEQGRDALHTAIDPHQDSDWERAGVRTIRDAGAEPFVRLIEEDSALALPALIAAGERFDLAFIDGGHHFECALLDVVYMLRLVRPRGLIVVDDLWMPAVRAAVEYARTNLGAAPLADPAWSPAAAGRFAILQCPAAPPRRPWDHFVPFWDAAPAGRASA